VFEVGGHEENGNFILNQQQMTYNARPLPQKNQGAKKGGGAFGGNWRGGWYSGSKGFRERE